MDAILKTIRNGAISRCLFGVRFLSKTLMMAGISGKDLMSDPLMRSMLYSMQLNSYLSLKKKARILVPDSATLIGVVDPTGTLEEGEVFVQIRRDSFKCRNAMDQMIYERTQVKQLMDDQTQVLTGNLMVTRNPCTHPGDIRVL